MPERAGPERGSRPGQPGRPEVLLIYKKSKLALYAHERKSERFQALLARGDEMAQSFIAAHEAHAATLAAVKRVVREAGLSYRSCYRARLTEKDTHGKLVVTIGGDGTLLDASHRIQDAVVLGVNSDPLRSVGFLCAARAEDFGEILEAALTGALAPTRVPRLAGSVDGVPLRFPVLNEILVAHKNPAATTRYLMRTDGHTETHKSSGIWIAGPAGSTAAIASAGGAVQDLDDTRMQVRVREPYVADADVHALVGFFVPKGRTLQIQSRMREGVLYLDGPHQKVPFPIGAELVIGPGGPPLSLYVTEAMERRREIMRARLAIGGVAPEDLPE